MNTLLKTVEQLRNTNEYCNYLAVREAVFKMLAEAGRNTERPSDYWIEEIAGFDYLFDASPLIIHKLREHCYHITGLHSYDYRGHHANRRDPFVRKLKALKERDRGDFFIPESPMFGGYGYNIDNFLVNLDTLKFYETVIALDRGNLLSEFHNNKGKRKTVLEIGAGWGGLAYNFLTLYPSIRYIIVDLPQTLLFSGTYLKTMFPKSNIFFYGEGSSSELTQNFLQYDLIFLPHYQQEIIPSLPLDLVMNTVSFQEMTTQQVGSYVEKVYQAGCPHVYSLNRDRSPHNKQLTSVRAVLSDYYDLREIEVLKVPYTSMLPNNPRDWISYYFRHLTRKINLIKNTTMYEYRHVVGTRKQKL